jgi:hypothetical protein
MAAMVLDSQDTENQTPEDVSPDQPLREDEGARQARQKEEEDEDAALKEIRRTFKQSWSIKRQGIVRRILKSFEYLKNNPYAVMNYGTGEMDPIAQVVAGNSAADDPDLYQDNDNVFQMLALSFIAALGPDVAKTRWMPDDPQEEQDLTFAKKASTMMAFIERMNDMPSKQRLKLLYLWTAGTYYTYVRNIVDAVRAGTSRQPVMAMQMSEVFPDRYLCPSCGTPNPSKQYNPFVNPSCFDCKSPLGQKDFYPAESMQMPVQVDEREIPNGMTAIDIFCALNVDTDPDAQEIDQSPLLDLEGEANVASIRASYPDRYKEIAKGQFSDEENAKQERTARERVTSATVRATLTNEEFKGTYSRCWIQAWAFNILEDQAMAQRLTKKYPKGVKLVTYGADLVLEKRPESMLEHWGEARTIKGLGMNPFGVGDVAISVQDRVDNTANNIQIYMDRMALPPVLANAALIDVNALGRNRWGGGRAIPVYPSQKTPGVRYNMQEALWQPTFHADTQIYGYSEKLMTLMQLLTGVTPQIFGGGTQAGVETASGQAQMLNTAMGRLQLFLNSIRSESAKTAKLAVKCMASDIDDQKRLVMDGQVDGQYENIFVLQSDVMGEIHAYPEPDQGFPASYGEMRDRLIQILGMVEKNPVLDNMLSDPDMQKLLALYLLPDGAKLPGDSERTKIKMILQQLSTQKPQLAADPATGKPMAMPSIQPDEDFDDMSTIETIAKDWAQRNYELATTNPNGYANVRAYFKLATTMASQKMAAQAALAASAPGGAPSPQQGTGQ